MMDTAPTSTWYAVSATDNCSLVTNQVILMPGWVGTTEHPTWCDDPEPGKDAYWGFSVKTFRKAFDFHFRYR